MRKTMITRLQHAIPLLAILLLAFIITIGKPRRSAQTSSAPPTLRYKLRADIDEVLASIANGTFDTRPFHKNRLLPPFSRDLSDFQVAPQYRLGLCTVPKIMSTINLAIFCFLKHPKRYMVEKRQISKERRRDSICSSTYARMSWPRSSRISLRFSVIRHPIDRFLSAYTDKCLRDCTHLCYGCGTDINCFIERFNSKIRYYARHSFHYLDELTYHLAPLNWFCGFKDDLRSFKFINYGNSGSDLLKMADDYDRLLEYANVERSIREEIKKELLVGKVRHSTYLSESRSVAQKAIFSNKTLMNILMEIYYYDFIIFNYSFPNPNFYLANCTHANCISAYSLSFA